MSTWYFLLLGAAVFVPVATTMRKRRVADRTQSLLEERMADDATDPLRRWAHGALLLVSRDVDYGHLTQEEGVEMLASQWDIQDRRDVVRVIGHLRGEPSGNAAWDLLCAMTIARAAAAARFLGPNESWAVIGPICQQLQSCYPDWETMAQAYASGRAAWIAAQKAPDPHAGGWIDENMKRLKSGLWQDIPFRLDFLRPLKAPARSVA